MKEKIATIGLMAAVIPIALVMRGSTHILGWFLAIGSFSTVAFLLPNLRGMWFAGLGLYAFLVYKWLRILHRTYMMGDLERRGREQGEPDLAFKLCCYRRPFRTALILLWQLSGYIVAAAVTFALVWMLAPSIRSQSVVAGAWVAAFALLFLSGGVFHIIEMRKAFRLVEVDRISNEFDEDDESDEVASLLRN